ncbi:hypothetical protein [Roseospirillum parvum]|uniref:Uncharacterized protein n=1 Tax=Roseospirillum parvum TaxID=83401 RepID=A0A1G8CLM0_9PROT|nr:hypothetical protein [Roseospirillum parvum]SDH46447.1 hypothetical protein SAMN05421742_10740 [Roseospirillum parvum]
MSLLRRQLLGGVGGLAALLAAAPARAFRLQAPTVDEAHDIAANRTCRSAAEAYHRALLSEAEAALDSRPDLDEEARRVALAEMACPVCGCTLLAAGHTDG